MSPYSDSVSLRLRCSKQLNLATSSKSPDHSSIGTPLGIPQSCPCGIALRLIVSPRFQVLFHCPLGLLFTFPSRYWFTIGLLRVFSLIRWSGQIHTRLHVPRDTWELRTEVCDPFAYRAFTFYGRPFQILRLECRFVTSALRCGTKHGAPRHPLRNAHRLWHAIGLGSSAFARRY